MSSSNNNKMKGLLKGLRYISQIFDNEKEQEMQISFPTDVKHVAHIGWDGAQAATTAPSWMNEFKSEGGASGPLPARAIPEPDSATNWVSQDSGARKVSRGQSATTTRDMPELPKSSRRSSSTNGNGATGESSMKEKSSDKVRQKKASKNSSKKERDPNQLGTDAPAVPKKSGRRKKSKDTEVGGSARRINDLDNGSESGSVSKGRLSSASSASGFDDGEGIVGHSGRIS